MTPERYQRLLNTLRFRQPDLTVVTDEVHKGRNLSAIIRTCDAVGIDTVHTVAPERGYRGYRGTASGSHKWVEVDVYDNLQAPLERLKALGHQIVATGVTPQSCSYLDVDYTRPTALLIGSEKQGVSITGMNCADRVVQIPMIGMVESLNVSVAAAIILQEAYRQRQLAGLYGKNQLAPAVQERRFFRWAHPEVANYCDYHAIDYPAVNSEDGEIIDPSGWYHKVKNSPTAWGSSSGEDH